MAGKAVAVLGILLGMLLAAEGVRLVEEEDTMSAWNVLDATKPLSNAVATATVSVVLISQRDVHVYGEITAYVGNIGISLEVISLFRRSRTEAIHVKPGFKIPLSISVIPEPVSPLTIRVNLTERQNTPNNDNQLARGAALFHPRNSGASSEIFPRPPFGTIVVKVDWRSPLV